MSAGPTEPTAAWRGESCASGAASTTRAWACTARAGSPTRSTAAISASRRWSAWTTRPAGALLLGAEKKDDVKKDLDKLQGDWTLESGERDGQKIPEEIAKTLKRTVKGNKSKVTRDGETLAEGTMTLDPAKKPKAIDMKL